MPTVFRDLDRHGIKFRRAGLHMIAAQPGEGKTVLALALARGMHVPTLYFAADVDEALVAARLIAMDTGELLDYVEPRVLADRGSAAAQLGGYDHIRWCFDPSPTLDDVADAVEAFEDLYGEPPWLIVIDNATDIVGEAGDEWGSLRSVVKSFQHLASATRACVVLLHHTSEAFESETGCPPRRSIQGKVAQKPSLVLTISYNKNGLLAICPVKNRYGQADPSGSVAAYLFADYARMQIRDRERVE